MFASYCLCYCPTSSLFKTNEMIITEKYTPNRLKESELNFMS